VHFVVAPPTITLIVLIAVGAQTSRLVVVAWIRANVVNALIQRSLRKRYVLRATKMGAIAFSAQHAVYNNNNVAVMIQDVDFLVTTPHLA
tara:strand:- start:729 stop:998 length:270 start_codon:yes stop_codon:yes gene_type:complete